MNKYECGLLAAVTSGFFALMCAVASYEPRAKDAEPTAPLAATNGWRLARIATEPIDGGVRLTLDLMEDDK